MSSVDKVMDDIEVLRDKLSSLIQIKGELLDPEVIQASVLLDNALNVYSKLKSEGSGTSNSHRICLVLAAMTYRFTI